MDGELGATYSVLFSLVAAAPEGLSFEELSEALSAECFDKVLGLRAVYGLALAGIVSIPRVMLTDSNIEGVGDEAIQRKAHELLTKYLAWRDRQGLSELG
jgi:hypothetical protein